MRIDVLGVGFDNITMDQAVAEGVRLMDTAGAHYVVTPNPEIVETCRQDGEAMEAVNGADLVLADGIGVIYGAKLLGTPLKGRVTGIGFAQGLMERMAGAACTCWGPSPASRSGRRRIWRGSTPACRSLELMTATSARTAR